MPNVALAEDGYTKTNHGTLLMYLDYLKGKGNEAEKIKELAGNRYKHDIKLGVFIVPISFLEKEQDQLI